jgi:hypothetical protein
MNDVMNNEKDKTLRDIRLAYGEVSKSKKKAYRCFHYLLWRLSCLGFKCPIKSENWLDYIDWGKSTAKEL